MTSEILAHVAVARVSSPALSIDLARALAALLCLTLETFNFIPAQRAAAGNAE
jgi:hypothetical protein